MPTWFLLAGLVGLSTALRLWAALAIPSPWITPDEQTYAELGRSLYDSARYQVLGQPAGLLSLIYPAVVGLPLALFGTDTGYAVLKVVQALVMSLTAVPVYLWGRSLTRRSWALAAAAMSLALPGLAYSGFLMSEVVFYPLVCVSAWAMARVLVDPSLERQALLLATMLLAFLTRLQAIVLVPVFVLAVVLKLLFERGRFASARRFAPLLAGVAVIAALWAVLVSRQQSSGGLLGTYEPVGRTGYGFARTLHFALYHAADLVLLSAVLPLVACLLLFVEALRGRERSPDVQGLVSVVMAYMVGFLAEVAFFSAGLSGRIGERYLLGLAPLLFLSLVVWLERSAPRRALPLLIIGALGLASLLLFPFGRFATAAAGPDAFTLVSLYRLGAAIGSQLKLAVVLGAAALLVLLHVARRRLAWLIPLVIIGLLAGASISASRFVSSEAKAFRLVAIGEDKHWIDGSAEGPVAFLYLDEPSWHGGEPIWANLFWNRSITRVYKLPGSHVFGPLPAIPVTVAADGRLLLADGVEAPVTNLVASNTLSFLGEQLNQDSSFILWRLQEPARVSTRIIGFRLSTGNIDVSAWIEVYNCARGRLALRLSAPSERTIVLSRSGVEYKRIRLLARRPWTGSIPAPLGNAQCNFAIATFGGGVHAERLEFVRPRP